MKGCLCWRVERRPRIVLQMRDNGFRGSNDSQNDFQRSCSSLSKRRWTFFCMRLTSLKSHIAFISQFLLSAPRRSVHSFSSSTSKFEWEETGSFPHCLFYDILQILVRVFTACIFHESLKFGPINSSYCCLRRGVSKTPYSHISWNVVTPMPFDV